MALASCENEGLNEFKHPNVANLICNDEYNHESCNFDGGDCCFVDPIGKSVQNQ